MPLTRSVAPGQEQALREPEPTGCPFLPWEVRLGSQKFGVTVQMYVLPEPAAPNLCASPPPGRVLTTTQISCMILRPPTLRKM